MIMQGFYFYTIHLIGSDPIPVWPYGEGDKRGLAVEPLYRSVPQSITQFPDQLFYELLVLVDAIRFGRARERNIAIKLLKEKIKNDRSSQESNIEFSNARNRSKKIRTA